MRKKLSTRIKDMIKDTISAIVVVESLQQYHSSLFRIEGRKVTTKCQDEVQFSAESASVQEVTVVLLLVFSCYFIFIITISTVITTVTTIITVMSSTLSSLPLSTFLPISCQLVV